MKYSVLLRSACFVLGIVTSLAAEGPKAPFALLPHARAEKARFEKTQEESHPWKESMPFPLSLRDAGLEEDAILVWTDTYLDGGTRGYLLADSNGNFLAICTGPGRQSKDHPHRIDAPIGSRLFIGGLHYREALMVEPGSKSEAFLRNVIEARETNKSTEPTDASASH